MPVATLTDLTTGKLKPPEAGATVYADKNLAGFGVRVTANGVKSYVLTHGAARRRLTLGRVAIVPLSDARQAVRELLAEQTLGKSRPDRITFGEVQNRFLTHVRGRRKDSTAPSRR